MFELKQLRCFVAVATELNFRRAAARLNMTQPPLTRQIQLLEHELGVQLFERTKHSVKPTTAGQVLLVDATRLLNLAEQAATTVRRASKGETGRVRIGFTGAAGHEIVPRLLAAAKEALPDIDVVVHELISAAQIEAFAANSIDLGIMRPLGSRQKLSSFLIDVEPLIVVLPASHPLAACAAIDLQSLNDQPFIMHSPDDGKYFHDRVMAMFWSAKVMPDFAQYIDQTHTIISMVRAGLGMSIVPASAQRFHFDQVVFRPIRDNVVSAEMIMAWRPDQRIPAVTALRQMAEEHFRTGSRPKKA
ncbi:LysR family transcriptional regulator [Massilia sp. JS1662]|nr:LysR family transcriptional regulator [Massilia sp. JS1662]KGF80192.1 LysR family transcriptional regulator [Massilia sp. JS1662]